MSVVAPSLSVRPELPDAFPLARRLEAACAGWRGPALSTLIVLLSALPGLFALPPLDRDESRFAQASAQMLETGDYVNIRFQAEPRDRKPVGIHWLQALSVRLLSTEEARDIWPYRVPSILGAMLAAAACAWGGAAAFGARGGAIAGGVLGASLLLSTEAFVGKTDAVLCGAITLSMAGLGRLYLAPRQGPDARGAVERWALWVGLALGILVKGPIAPMVVGLAVASLVCLERRWEWLGRLGWSWGWLIPLVLIGPWAFAVTVSTDGAFWSGMSDDIAPKIVGSQERHGGPPGLHALLAPLLLFPSGFLLPAAAVAGWRRRTEPAVRFALAWLIAPWVVFELLPTKLPHYPLPLYGALAWLVAAAATGDAIELRARRLGAGLGGVAAIVVAGIAVVGAVRFGAGSSATVLVACATALIALATAAVGGLLLMRERPTRALAAAGVLGVLAHMLLSGVAAPGFTALWISDRAATLLAKSGLDPRDGRTVGPVTVAGYAEPSLVFALGTDTELAAAGADAAETLAAGSPAFVEDRQETAFKAALAKRGAEARGLGSISGFDYSDGHPVRLTLWRPVRLPPVPPAADPIVETDAPPERVDPESLQERPR